MKKIISVLLFLFIYISVQSQEIGIRVEYDYASNKFSNGIRFSPFVGFNVSTKWQIDLQLDFTQFWYNSSDNSGNVLIEESAMFGCIGFGADVLYQAIPLNHNQSLVIGLGAKLSFFAQPTSIFSSEYKRLTRPEIRMPLLYNTGKIGSSNWGMKMGLVPGYIFSPFAEPVSSSVFFEGFFYVGAQWAVYYSFN